MVTHQCPSNGVGKMPCCGKTPFEVPRFDRMTLNTSRVDCNKEINNDPAK